MSACPEPSSDQATSPKCKKIWLSTLPRHRRGSCERGKAGTCGKELCILLFTHTSTVSCRLTPSQCPELRWQRGKSCALSHHRKQSPGCPQCQPVTSTKTSGHSSCATSWGASVEFPGEGPRLAHTTPACAIKEAQHSLQLLTWATHHLPIYLINFMNLRALHMCHLNGKGTALERLLQE